MVNTNITGRTSRLSVSTWSLNRLLGRPDYYGPDRGDQIPISTHGAGEVSLLQVPSRIAAFGIRTLEICHFHLPSREGGYLNELRSSLEDEGIELFSLLVDGGDITHPDYWSRDLDWIGGWIEIAGTLGAKCARVIAGKSVPSKGAMEVSLRGLRKLAERAEAHGVRLMTENWFDLLSRPEYVSSVIESLEGRVGLCLDFGNWKGPTKYTDLASIAPYAESCHAKAHFKAPFEMEVGDFVRCLEITKGAGFSGPYTLIYDGPGDDEWEGLTVERDVVLPYLAKRVKGGF